MLVTNTERFLTLRLLDAMPVGSFEDARKMQAAHAALAGDWNWDEVQNAGLDNDQLQAEADISADFDKAWLASKIEGLMTQGSLNGAQARIMLSMHAKLDA